MSEEIYEVSASIVAALRKEIDRLKNENERLLSEREEIREASGYIDSYEMINKILDRKPRLAAIEAEAKEKDAK